MSEFAASRASRSLVGSMALLGLVAASCGSADGDELETVDAPVSTDGSVSAVAGEVVVFAAASLTEAFTEMGDAFIEANPDASATFNFAASSALVAQIVEGAPADVYASADLESMARLTNAEANAGEPIVFADNRSAILVAEGNPLGIIGVEDLGDDELIVVTCAPEVPCGTAATRIFDNAGVTVNPDSFAENVKAVVTKVTLGEADAGIVYATDVTAVGDDADGVEIPADLNVVAEYPIVLTTEAPNPDGGQAFIDFVLGDAGRAILVSHGFTSP